MFFHFLSLTLWNTHSRRQLSSLKGCGEKKREMVPVIFTLLTRALVQSLSQNPRGEDIKQRKSLSHFIVFYHRELISLFSFPYLFYTSLIFLSSIFALSRPSMSALYLFLNLYFIVWHFVKALWVHHLVKNIERAKREKRGQSREGGFGWRGERQMTVLNPNSSLSHQRDVWRAWGAERKSHLRKSRPWIWQGEKYANCISDVTQ